MRANRLRKANDRFTLRGWTYAFHQFQDGPQFSRLETDTDEVQIWNLHSRQTVEVRPGDIPIIAEQIGYTVPAAKRKSMQQPTEPPSPEQPSALAAMQEKLERLERERDEARAAYEEAERRAAEAESAAVISGDDLMYDRLRDVEWEPPKDLVEDFSGMLAEGEDLSDAIVRGRMVDDLNQRKRALQNEKSYTEEDNPELTKVSRILKWLAVGGAKRV